MKLFNKFLLLDKFYSDDDGDNEFDDDEYEVNDLDDHHDDKDNDGDNDF